MHKFVINLDRSKDRWDFYKNGDYTKWSATDYKDLNDNDLIFSKMLSYYNINPIEHKAKCACFLSHTNIWRYIIANNLKEVLILEDDAEPTKDIPNIDLPQDGFTYLGGYFYNIKMVDGAYKGDTNTINGLNKIDKSKFRMMMNLAYYIPNAKVAQVMLDYVINLKRYRAIDTLMLHIPCNQYYLYPAIFIEMEITSTIRKNKKKHSNEYYKLI